MEALSIEGAWLYTPRSTGRPGRASSSGSGAAEFAGDLGYRLDVAQVNCSVSRRGVIRGIHFADVPPGQAKYVSCVAGAILDVVVDLRAGSPSFGAWEAVRLDDESRQAVFLAEGLGHAFMALSDRPPCSTCARRRTPRPASTACTRWTRTSASAGRSGRRAGPVGQGRRRAGAARRRAGHLRGYALPGYAQAAWLPLRAAPSSRCGADTPNGPPYSRSVRGTVASRASEAARLRSRAGHGRASRRGRPRCRASRQSPIGASPAGAQASWPSTL